jgi:monofunctional biosynthetic peptidoglycan transglycosylase
MPVKPSPLLDAARPRERSFPLMFWKKRNLRRVPPTGSSERKWGFWLRRAALVFGALIVLDALYLALRLPDWDEYATGPIPKSSFIAGYEDAREDQPEWPALRWKPVPLSAIPKHVIRAVVVAEDSRFFSHGGFDTEAWQDAMEHNLAKGRFVYGGSTISQQTVKNLFFTPSRNPLRKWHEFVYTWLMEKNLKKRRIIELYLNVAEFGRGVYGVEAAAQRYWGVSISDVGEDEAIELAATLPGPVNHNPASRTRFFLRHKRTVARHYYRS